MAGVLWPHDATDRGDVGCQRTRSLRQDAFTADRDVDAGGRKSAASTDVSYPALSTVTGCRG